MNLNERFRCPKNAIIFPAMEVDRATKSLYADFKAFRFPSTGTINFVATVAFCEEQCEPVTLKSAPSLFHRILLTIHWHFPQFGSRLIVLKDGTRTGVGDVVTSPTVPLLNPLLQHCSPLLTSLLKTSLLMTSLLTRSLSMTSLSIMLPPK